MIRLTLHPIIALLVAGAACAPGVTGIRPAMAEGQVWEEVPFTDFSTPWHLARLDINARALAARLRINGRQVPIEPGVLPLKLLALDDTQVYLFGRTLFAGELQVAGVNLTTGQTWSVQLPDEIRRERLFRQAAVFGREVVMVAYHIHDHYSLFVYRFVPDSRGVLAFDASYVRQIAFQGRYEISTPVRMAVGEGSLYICGEGFCYRDCGVGTPCYREPLTLLDHGVGTRRLVELASAPDGSLAGLYQDVDPPADLAAGRAFRVIDIPSGKPRPDWQPSDRIPFHLRWVAGRPTTDPLEGAVDLPRLFEADIRRGEASGLLNLGENNVEGRVAWSQVYYLSGLITLIRMVDAGQAPEFVPLRGALARRVHLEIALWDRLLATAEPHMRSRRYTVARAPALHAVQTGRILRTLARYRQLRDARPLDSFFMFRDQVRQLDGHIEAVRVATPEDRWLPAGRRNLWWPRGAAFPTFDGVTIPFNHMDDWAGGVLYGEGRGVRDEEFALTARDCLRILLDEEFADGLPRDYRWNYWFGQVEAGWSAADNVSVHVPTYAGERYVAHVSYLTIDMMALLSVGRVYPEILPPGILDYLEDAVEQGALYPFLAEDLENYGRRPVLPHAIALRYLRPESAGAFQSTVWAYRAFASPTP